MLQQLLRSGSAWRRKVLRYIVLLTLMLGSCTSRQPKLVLTAKPVAFLSDAKPGLDIANVALQSGALATAEHVVEGVLSGNPNDVSALLLQAEVLRQTGNAFVAETAIQHAYSIKPRDVRVLTELGKIQLGDDAVSAELTFRRALSVSSGNEATMTDLGVSLDMQGKHEEAQSVYRAALLLGGGNQLATRVDLGLSLALSGSSREAIEQLRPAAALPNVSSRVRQDLAAALTLAGDKSAAESILGHDMSEEQVASLISGYEALR